MGQFNYRDIIRDIFHLVMTNETKYFYMLSKLIINENKISN